MNWITNVRSSEDQEPAWPREVPENLWIKCPETGEMVFHKRPRGNQYVIPNSGYHMR
jgi:acetyl-CoA carboxylase carboxyl transferase subunit beta